MKDLQKTKTFRTKKLFYCSKAAEVLIKRFANKNKDIIANIFLYNRLPNPIRKQVKLLHRKLTENNVYNPPFFLRGSRKTCQKNFDSILLVYKYFFLTKTNPTLGIARKSINFSKLEVDLKKTHFYHREE